MKALVLSLLSIFLLALKLSLRVVGSVGDVAFTNRDLEIRHFIELALFHHQGAKGPAVEFPLPEKEFSQSTNKLLIEYMVYKEALALNVQRASSVEVSAARNTLHQYVEHSPGKPYWERLEVLTAELNSTVERVLTARDFMTVKTRSSNVHVTDAEAQDYYQRHHAKFGTLPFSNFRENIKGFLSQQQAEERMKSWFEILNRKYKAKNLALESK